MTVDPFAAAQVAGAAGTTAVADDPFVSSHDLDDPFATSSDFRGGDFTPSPTLETLRGRLLVMIPRDFDPKAKNPFYKKQGDTEFRELYTVDLYVLDGGKLVFPYKVKGDPDKRTQDEYKDYDAGVPSAENPFAVTRFWVPQGGLIGKLKKCHAKGAPFLGVLDIVPQADGRKAGVTTAQIRAEWDAYVARNRVGAKPEIAWAMDDPTPERRAIAIAWWAANKDNIAAVNTSTAPSS